MKPSRILLTLLCSLCISVTFAQDKITPALQTLLIAPDARSSGMGEVGVATSPDVFSQRWNAAKYAFMEDKGGVGISYVPWLRNIAKDVHLGYLSGYYSLPQNQAIGASLYFFSLGNINLYNETADYLASVKPTEFAFDVSYSRSFGPNLAGALTFRYINSTVVETGMGVPYNDHVHNFAVDVSTYWHKPIRMWGKEQSEVALGFNFSNIGTKLKTGGGDKYFLPMNLRVGGRITSAFDELNSLSLSLDLNKLLVPEDYQYNDDAVPTALFRSFGDGASSIMTNVGLEYQYNQVFFARAGFYAEANRLGGRQYISFGLGLCYRPITLDVSYLTAIKGQDGILSNTYKFSLIFAIKERRKVRAE